METIGRARFRVSGLGNPGSTHIRVSGFGVLGFRVLGLGFRVSGVGNQDQLTFPHGHIN